MAEALLVAACEQACAGRTTEGMRHITIRAAQSRSRQGIQMRRGHIPIFLKPHVLVTVVIGDNHQHIGPLHRIGGGGSDESDEKRKEKAN